MKIKINTLVLLALLTLPLLALLTLPLLALLTLPLAAPAAPAPKAPMVLLGPPAAIDIRTDRDNEGAVTLEPETRLIVRLRARPGTGYEWNLLMPPHSSLALTQTPTYTPIKVGVDRLGAGGIEEFDFSPIYLPGVTQSLYLRLISLRAFEKGISGASLFELHVIIPPQWVAVPQTPR